MVEEKDVDTFIKAKKDQLAIDILQGLSLASLTVLIALEALQVTSNYTICLATLTAVFMLGAMGQSKWVAISRSQLIETLERIINTDSEALKMLAEKRKSGVSTSKRA